MSKWRAMLKEAKELLDEGFINEQDYEKMKQEALALRSQSTNPGTTTPPMPPSSVLQDIGTVVGEPSTVEPSIPVGLDSFGTIVEQQTLSSIGNYKLLAEIGQGGMGTVYRARHGVEAFAKRTGDVVIKLMNSELSNNSDFVDRFIGEAALGRRIKHSNFVDIHDIIHDPNTQTLAIVMDLVEGRPLDKQIPEGGMSLEEALPIIEQLSDALDHIHKQGIIHRDLKPDNIIVQPDGTPIILDMGIAKDTTDSDMSKTSTGVAMGTPLYMAPEQLDAKNATISVDRYAFGLIVYQMLSGRLPWDDGLGQGEILACKFGGNLDPLKGHPKHVGDAVMGLLRASAGDRWGTCAEFMNAFVESEEDRAKRLAAERAEQERVERELQILSLFPSPWPQILTELPVKGVLSPENEKWGLPKLDEGGIDKAINSTTAQLDKLVQLSDKESVATSKRLTQFLLKLIRGMRTRNEDLRGLQEFITSNFQIPSSGSLFTYVKLHSQYFPLITHILRQSPKTKKRWGQYWTQLADIPMQNPQRNTRKEIVLLLSVLIRGFPKQFPIEAGHILHLCIFDGQRYRSIPSKDPNSRIKQRIDKLKPIQELYDELAQHDGLNKRVEKGLDWLRYLVLRPEYLSKNVSPDLWHPKFSKTPCALVFPGRSSEDFTPEAFAWYRKYIHGNQDIPLEDVLEFVVEFSGFHQRLPTGPDTLKDILDLKLIHYEASNVQSNTPLTIAEVQAGQQQRSTDCIAFPINNNVTDSQKGGPNKLMRFSYLMNHWEALNSEKGKRHGWGLFGSEVVIWKVSNSKCGQRKVSDKETEYIIKVSPDVWNQINTIHKYY